MSRREVATCDCCKEEAPCELYPLKERCHGNAFSLYLATPHQKSMIDLCIPCAKMINGVIAEAVDEIRSTPKEDARD